jgi:hypothetical protein
MEMISRQAFGFRNFERLLINKGGRPEIRDW